MEKQKYQLTIKFEFDAWDDLDARMIAEDLTESHFDFEIDPLIKCEEKLQQIFDNKQPRKVEL
jgi:hypothetical protein